MTVFFSFFFFHTHLLSRFWTNRGHRCRLFPPGSFLQCLSRIGFSNPTCSSIFHRVLLTHALALSASQFVRKKKSPRICANTHSGGFELTKLTYTRLEDHLIRHWGDRIYTISTVEAYQCFVIPLSSREEFYTSPPQNCLLFRL